MNDIQIASPEYIHGVVAKFVDDLINRRIYFSFVELMNRKDPQGVTDAYADFTKLITIKYFDMRIIGKERAELEKELFGYIVIFTAFNVILPSKYNPSIDEQRIDKLERKIESTNKLLTSVLQILQEIKNKTDNLP